MNQPTKTILYTMYGLTLAALTFYAIIGVLFMSNLEQPSTASTCDEINVRQNHYTKRMDTVCEIKLADTSQPMAGALYYDTTLRAIKDTSNHNPQATLSGKELQ